MNSQSELFAFTALEETYRQSNEAETNNPVINEHDYHMEILEKPEIHCGDFTALLGDYADNELPPSLKNRLDAHAKRCEYCDEMKKQYLFTIKVASEITEKTVPVDVQNRLREALNLKLGLNLPKVD